MKSFTKHPPHSTEDEEGGPPNAENRGVNYILRNSVILAVIAMVVVFLAFFVF
ncbi:MAG: hypothetical protein AAF371_17380 [Pseudomonadota bacterium]